MTGFVVRRLIVLVGTLFVVSVIAFLVPYVSGSDPARTILRGRVSDFALDSAAVEAVRLQFGLDQPLYVQYIRWLESAIVGDFGRSFASQVPVIDLVINGLIVSIILALAALLLAVVLAVPLGVFAATRAGSRSDTTILLLTQGLVALPEYWLAPLGILVFALGLGLLPAAGWLAPESVILPAAVLSLRPLAYLLGVTRASMITVLSSAYITAARARGLSQWATLRRHAVKNSMVPVMTLFSIWLAGTLGGSVVVEVIFSVPGLGRVMYQAVTNGDVPLIQGGVVAVVALAVVVNTITDIGYAVLNPAVVVGDSHG